MKRRFLSALALALALIGRPDAARPILRIHRVNVTDAHALEKAIAAAVAGDEIVLAPGQYRLGRLQCNAAGTREMPITVRAEPALGAKLEFDAVEGFFVSGPYWQFENLDIRGVCANDSTCEHAFHVVGAADWFVLRGNRIFDFNAHLKVNAAAQAGGVRDIPDNGLVESNEFGNSHPRNTDSPVTPADIDNGSRWVVRLNYVHDFHKQRANSVSFGVFVKGGGHDPIFEQNLILCERNVASAAGEATVGLSFGGGGMDPAACAPAFNAKQPCDPEVAGGIIRNNIIVNCTDVGIYLNRAKGAQLLHNTLIGTSGIDVRFSSVAGIHGNVFSGLIRIRDGGTYSGADNLSVTVPVLKAWYIDPLKGDLRMKGSLSSILRKGTPSPLLTQDYCGRNRSVQNPDWGAVEHSLGDCQTARHASATP